MIAGIFAQSLCQDGCCESDPRCTDFDFIMAACLDSSQAGICPVTCKTCSSSQTTTAPSVTLPMTTSASCQDTNPTCFDFDFIITGCRDPDQAKFCPQMCGLCSVTSTTTTPLPTTTTTTTTNPTIVCEDSDPRCLEFDFLITGCLDSEQAKICPKACGLCSAATQPDTQTTTALTTTQATTTLPPQCKDTDQRCLEFDFIVSICLDAQQSQICPVACGLCTDVRTPLTTTTTTTTTAPTTTLACVDTDSRCLDFNFIITACLDPVLSKLCPRICQLC